MMSASVTHFELYGKKYMILGFFVQNLHSCQY